MIDTSKFTTPGPFLRQVAAYLGLPLIENADIDFPYYSRKGIAPIRLDYMAGDPSLYDGATMSISLNRNTQRWQWVLPQYTIGPDEKLSLAMVFGARAEVASMLTADKNRIAHGAQAYLEAEAAVKKKVGGDDMMGALDL